MWSKLRKFGLNECTLRTMVENSAVLLRVLSLNLEPDYKKDIPIIFNIFTLVICICYFYVYVFSMVWFVFFKCMETGDVISAMIVFALGIASEISTIKFIYMIMYQESLRNIINKFLIHDSKGDSNSRFTNNQHKVLRRVKKRAMIFWMMIMGNGVVYAIKPLLMPGRHNMEDVEFLYGDVLATCHYLNLNSIIKPNSRMWPFSLFKTIGSVYPTRDIDVTICMYVRAMNGQGLKPLAASPNYEIAYFLSLGGVIFTCYGTANISGFFIIITGYIEAQMFSLSEELLSVWNDAQNYYYNNFNGTETCFRDESEDILKEKHRILNKYVEEQLHYIIDYHTTNINFLNQIENVFCSAIAIEFGLLIISLIAEFLGGLENTYLLVPYALVQVTMDCITGQKLLDSSIMFERAVYESKWENFDMTNMKTVLMMLVNSQKGVAISAGGLVKLSFICLMSVGRMIYQTYTALRSAVNR